MNTSADFNVDAILDGTLDDLADMPEFRPYPAGTHRFHLTLVNKTAKKDWINGHPAVEAKMKLIETVELANPADAPLTAGAETSVLYMLDNELGQGSFKNLMKALVAHFGARSNRELMEECRNLECLGVTKLRANKDKTKEYTDLVEIQVV